MSFVEEILTSAAKVETENLNKKISDTTSAIIGYKEKVLEYCDKVYVEYSERPKSNPILLKRANELTNNIVQLQETIDSIASSKVDTINSKITTYKKELQENKYTLQVADTLIQFHEALIQIKACVQNKEYIEGVKQIQYADQLLDSNDMHYINAFDGLVENLIVTKACLMTELDEKFKTYVQYNENKPYTLLFKGGNNIENILMALGLANPTIAVLDEVTAFLWEFILCPVINYKTSVNITENDKDSKITLHIIDINEKQNYKEVFENIKHIFKFFSNSFNYSLRNNMSTLIYIGNILNDKLSDLIIKNCLSDIMPHNSEELQRYKDVIEEAELLQRQLTELGIFREGMDAISKYTNNVECHFIDMKCQEYIISAREIMKRDLHEMVEVGIPYDEIHALSNSSNVFPQCFISKSTLDLIELTNKIMESAKSYKVNVERLYSTAQNILYNYGDAVQSHHQKLLQTIPQQVALFHNNCMFLSHKLSTSIELYYLPNVPSSDPALFIEKAHLIKQIGDRAFVECLEQQIKQIEEILKEAGLTSANFINELDPKTEKCIRQCLRQQELLKTVWHKVLSYLDYNRSIGCILNFLCNFIVMEALKIEDISSEAGEQLVDILRVILTRGPKLFTDSKDVHLYVKCWYKFNELVFVLSSNLTEISDRWADGKGPLALQFKAEEIQKLIRALFQNTDRRAAVLARIIN